VPLGFFLFWFRDFDNSIFPTQTSTDIGARGNARKTPPNEADAFYAELNKSDAFLMLASCFHGGSANVTKDEYRLVFGTFVTWG
jgi:hypothetical protein